MNTSLYETNIARLVEQQAEATPDAVAVAESRDRSTTYRRLQARADDICAYLRERNHEPETAIAVMLPRDAEMIAVLLGILKAGLAYVPVDPDDPPDRQTRILRTSGAPTILSQPRLISRVRMRLASEAGAVSQPTFVDVASIRRSEGPRSIECAPGGPRLAYVLFTSGSTGEPKGVEVEHHSVVNLLTASRNLLGFTANDCYLAASTIGFDISVAELFLPLTTGGRILLRDRSCWLQPRKLAIEVREFGVTVVQTGPSTWSMLLAEAPDFPRVRVAVSTAEAISPDLARRLTEYGDAVWNLYGPTETTVWSTAYRLNRAALDNRQHNTASVPIGHPLANTEVCVVDPDLNPVPHGSRGELCIAGKGLARCYRGDPERTNARFVRLGHDGARYYRTGDIVEWSRDGDLLFHGRMDDELKIRGYRIDPGEVESALLLQPGVRHAAVTWFESASGARSILAAVVRQPGANPTPSMLRQGLAVRLPEAMLPSRFVFCESLPLSAAGKVDRPSLRTMPADDVPEPTSQRNAQMTDTERQLAALWRRVLNVEVTRREDHFFTIGGDSLAAARVLTLIHSQFGVELPVRAFFDAPSLGELADRIDRSGGRAPGPFARLAMMLDRLLRRHQAPMITSTPPPLSETVAPGNSGHDLLAQQRHYVASWKGLRRRDDSLVVTRNEQGSRPGLFWCLQGHRELVQLATHLGPEQPVHGMRSGYLLIDYDKPDEIDLLAAPYAGEIDAIQPAGPLVLGGNCQGGIVIRRVAELLGERGREVGLLILMETRYHRPYAGRVALIYGRESHLNPYVAPEGSPDASFRMAYPAGYDIEFIEGAHGGFFESPNIESLAVALKTVLSRVRSAQHPGKSPDCALTRC